MTLDVRALGLLADFKTRNSVAAGDTSRDTLFEQLLWVATKMLEGYCGRVFSYNGAIVESVAGHGTTVITLAQPPIWSIASIVDHDGQTIDVSLYEISPALRESGCVTNETGWLWTALQRADGASWLPLPGSERAENKVTYAGGWQTPAQVAAGVVVGVDPLPPDITEACYMAATYLLARAGSDPALRGENLMSYGAQYGNVADTMGSSGLPRIVEMMVNSYVILGQA